MKFILLVEGQTERNSAAGFLKQWLDARLSQPVGIQPVSFNGNAELVRKMATKAKMYLEGPRKAEVVAVIGLLDLYGPPNFFPANITTAQEQFDWGVEYFQKDVGQSKFRMFFAVHEFESWLLSQSSIFPREVRDHLPKKIATPEQVNFDEPPAKLLDRIWKNQIGVGYKKTTYGAQLFNKLDPTVAAEKCPCLKRMLDEMLKLAKGCGL